MKASRKRRRNRRSPRFGPRVPKLCGADIELGNFMIGSAGARETCSEAAHSLLQQIDGYPRRRWYQQPVLAFADSGGSVRIAGVPAGSQDWGRRYLAANGGCAYIDLNHLEICLPEVRSAFDHVAAWHAMLRIARQAQETASACRSPAYGSSSCGPAVYGPATSGRPAHSPSARPIQVLVNNSDGGGNSYGSHLDFLLEREAWNNIFERKLQYQLFLAAHQVSSIVYTGAGKVGSENGAPPAAFQLSQRADFFERLCGSATTFHRPIVNSRDEPLCGAADRSVPDGPAHRLARLHVIFHDNTLAHVASILKVGAMQIVLAMIEAERVPVGLALQDPLQALAAWSRDPAMRVRARTVGGNRLTAVELQMRIVEHARRFAEAGGCDGVVPRAEEILSLWEETLTLLEAGDITALAPRIDWALKLLALTRALDRRPDLDWSSPEIKHLDHIYASLDPAEGLYWAYERSGFAQRVVSEPEIERFVHEPPTDTRAWCRAHLLRFAGPERIDGVDWDAIRFRLEGDGIWSRRRKLEMPDPLAFTEAETASIVYSGADLETVLDALEEL
jgi:Pup amidohydrolase